MIYINTRTTIFLDTAVKAQQGRNYPSDSEFNSLEPQNMQCVDVDRKFCPSK